MIGIGNKAPSFKLQADNGSMFDSHELAGARALLVFYPGDNTPVCTRQLCEYRDEVGEFDGLGVRIIGISKDGQESHQGFKERHELPFTLLSDPDLEVAQSYGAKGMMGMKRAVFLLDEKGLVRYEHIESVAVFRRRSSELLDAIRAMDD